eukprot:gene13732-16784_t
MRSTGEVMGWDRTFPLAFLKAQMGAGVVLPETGRVFVSIKDMDKTPTFAAALRDLIALGFELVATKGTATWLTAEGIAATQVNKVWEGRPNIVDRLKNNDIALVMNTTEGTQAVSDSRDIRRVALMDKIPYFTTAAASIAVTPGSTRISRVRQAGSPASSASNTAEAMAKTPGSPPDTTAT